MEERPGCSAGQGEERCEWRRVEEGVRPADRSAIRRARVDRPVGMGVEPEEVALGRLSQDVPRDQRDGDAGEDDQDITSREDWVRDRARASDERAGPLGLGDGGGSWMTGRRTWWSIGRSIVE